MYSNVYNNFLKINLLLVFCETLCYLIDSLNLNGTWMLPCKHVTLWIITDQKQFTDVTIALLNRLKAGFQIELQ